MEWVTSWYYGYDGNTLYIVVRDKTEEEVRQILNTNFRETGPMSIVTDEVECSYTLEVSWSKHGA